MGGGRWELGGRDVEVGGGSVGGCSRVTLTRNERRRRGGGEEEERGGAEEGRRAEEERRRSEGGFLDLGVWVFGFSGFCVFGFGFLGFWVFGFLDPKTQKPKHSSENPGLSCHHHL